MLKSDFLAKVFALRSMGNELVMSPLKFAADRCANKERGYSLVACLSSGTVTVFYKHWLSQIDRLGTLYICYCPTSQE